MISLLDAHGNPLAPPKPSPVSAIAGAGRRENTPYDAANIYSQRMAGWQPFLWSPDAELNMFRDRIVSRVRDLVRNDGWASGSVTSTLDNVVGANFRPIAKPDYRALAAYSGLSTFDAQWAADYGRALEAAWRTWSEDLNRYCDAARKMTISQIFRLAFRHKLIDGDSLALMLWQKDRIGYGKSRYATTVQLIDPDRLSNPQLNFDTQLMRGGVAVDHLGAATGYYIRRAHMGDWFNAGDSMHWDLIPRETPWGRPMVVHDFDVERAGQHRGGAGILTPVLERMKMLTQYDGAELDANVINAIFGAYIKSPFDPQVVQSALGNDAELNQYQTARGEFHKGGGDIALGGARLPQLFPGEDIVALRSDRPNTAYSEFQSTFLRNIAAATGGSYEQISKDWSKTNYSSARGALLEAWKTLGRRRLDFASGFASQIFSCFAEESHFVDKLPVPSGAPDFIECRLAYSRARWIGPGRGWVDPLKERQGAMLGIEACFSTLENEAAENGFDWEENLEQRAQEVEAFKKRGLPLPSWGSETDEVVQTEKIG